MIHHPHGLLLTLFLFVALRVGEIALNYMAGIGLTLTTAKELAIGNGIDILLVSLVLLVLKEAGNVDIGKLLFQRVPSLRESLQWGSVGIALSIPGFLHASSLPTYFDYEGYVTFALLHISHLAIAMPFIYEKTGKLVCASSSTALATPL